MSAAVGAVTVALLVTNAEAANFLNPWRSQTGVGQSWDGATGWFSRRRLERASVTKWAINGAAEC